MLVAEPATKLLTLINKSSNHQILNDTTCHSCYIPSNQINVANAFVRQLNLNHQNES